MLARGHFISNYQKAIRWLPLLTAITLSFALSGTPGWTASYTITIFPTGQYFNPAGGAGSVTGNVKETYSVAANSGNSRTGTLTTAGKTFNVAKGGKIVPELYMLLFRPFI